MKTLKFLNSVMLFISISHISYISCTHSHRVRMMPGDVNQIGIIIPVERAKSLHVISPFGARRQHGRRLHNGIDIAAKAGTAVIAPQDGKIVRIATGRTAGNYIWLLDFRGEYLYEFLHLQNFARGIHEGQFVRQRTVIGYVGNTGNAVNTSPHLHFGIARLFEKDKIFGKKRYLDPELFFR